MEKHDKDQLKAMLDCREVAEHFGIDITSRTANRYQARCFNKSAHNNDDRKASLAVKEDGFYCYGCKVSGDVFTLIAYMLGQDSPTDFKSVLEYAQQLAGWRPQPHANPTIKPSKFKKVELDPGLNLNAPPRPPLVLDPNTPAARALESLWDILKDGAPSINNASLQQWCQQRHINTNALVASGVRVVEPHKSQVLDWFENTPLDVLQSIGFVRDDGELTWMGLTKPGALFPIFHPTRPYPISWRIRFFHPGKMAKALATYKPSFHEEVVYLPLGLVDELKPGTHLFVCEGETDYGALLSARAELEDMFSSPVHVIGLCNMQGFIFRPVFNCVAELLSQAQAVFNCVDMGKHIPKAKLKAGHAVTRRLFMGIMHRRLAQGRSKQEAYDSAKLTLVDFIQPDERDINDLWCQRRLFDELEHALDQYVEQNPKWTQSHHLKTSK